MAKIEDLYELKRKAEVRAESLLKKEDYSQDDNKVVDQLLADAALYENQIRGLKDMEAREAVEAKQQLERDERDFEAKKEKTEYRFGEGFTKYVLRGEGEMKEDRSAGIQTVTTTAGGYTIPEGWMKNIKEALLAYGGVYENAFKFATPSGNDIAFPNINDTSNSAFQVSINTSPVDSSSNAALTFGTKTFKSYKWTSGLVQVPIELLQDSDISPVLEQLIVNALKERMWRGLNTAFTTGVGSTTISGVVTGAYDAGGTVAATALTRDNILDLYHAVDPAYRVGAKFMFNDKTLQAIKKLSFGTSDNRPLWQAGMSSGAPDIIEGKPYVINQDMADIGASAKSILFGDLQNYYIREVADWRLVRLTERYAELDQVAFALFSRWDGQVVDAGTHPIKYLVHAAS